MGLLLLRHLRRGQTKAALAAGAAAALACAQIGWGGNTFSLSQAQASRAAAAAGDGREFALLAFNVHNTVDQIDKLADLLDRENVDFVSLQEVPSYNRARFTEGLPKFSIYHADENAEFEHDNWGAFASITGVRRGLLPPNMPVKIDTGITSYRTFATRFLLNDAKLWVVNVHSTKAFWLHDGILGVFKSADDKSRWHFNERDDLVRWLGTHASDAVLAAGDFNAPHYASNVRLAGMHNAHEAVGTGPHLTIPSGLPIWGLDHALGNDRIVFTDYRLIDSGYSDHRAQLIRFKLRPSDGR